MDTYKEFCIRFWEATRELDLYSMDGSQLNRLIVDALLKTNGGEELIKTSTNELSVLIRAINHNNRKIQPPSLPSNLDEAAEKNFETMEVLEHENIFEETHNRIFKSGAEWMAGQGETFNGYISMKGKRSLIAIEGKSDYKFGDRVVVQIRKL